MSVGLIDLGPVPGAVPPAYIGERFGHDGCQSRHCRLYQSSGCRLTLFRPDFCITLLVVWLLRRRQMQNPLTHHAPASKMLVRPTLPSAAP